MFSGYAALTIETMRERRIAAQQHQRELDLAEVRGLDASVVPSGDPSGAGAGRRWAAASAAVLPASH